MSIRVLHNGEVKSAVPYVKHNGEVKIPTSGWTKVNGELKQIYPEGTVVVYDQASLEDFRDRVNAGETSLDVMLAADIELTGEWTPIADYSNNSLQYKGTFDGGGHTITGLTINSSSDYQGLFGRVGSGGVVKDITLKDVSVSGNNYVGGIVGCNYGKVIGCTNEGNITATGSYSYVGGIAGYCNQNGTVTDCTNTGNVSGANAGDIVGGGTAASASVSSLSVGGISDADTSDQIAALNAKLNELQETLEKLKNEDKEE